jgi:DNA-binding transcriptional LysR family regulator
LIGPSLLPHPSDENLEQRLVWPRDWIAAIAVNWNTLDLNLLVIFDAVMQEKNLTRAGRRIGMSQPAVSHALARLRHMLKDELFVRTPEGMRPTPRAERMFEPIHAALQELQVTLEEDEFDASRASRTFTIVSNNYASRAVVPALARRVAALAPSVVLDVRPTGMLHVLDQLDGGSVELALSTLTEGGDRFKCVGLLEDDYVAVLASDHPIAAEAALSIEHLASLPQIDITSSGDNTHFVDEALAERGFARIVSAKVPLHSLSSMLIGSRALAVVPRRVAADFVAKSQLIMRPLPFASPRISLSMIWHRRLDNHAAHRWLRATLRATVAGT